MLLEKAPQQPCIPLYVVFADHHAFGVVKMERANHFCCELWREFPLPCQMVQVVFCQRNLRILLTLVCMYITQPGTGSGLL